ARAGAAAQSGRAASRCASASRPGRRRRRMSRLASRRSLALLLLEQIEHAGGLEPLTDQGAVQPVGLAGVGDGLAAAQTPGQRGLEQLARIEAAEDLVDGVLRRGPGDPGALDLSRDAQLSALPDGRLAARDGLGGTIVVDGALFKEPRNRL